MEKREALLYYIGMREDRQEEGHLFIHAPLNSVYLQEIMEELMRTHHYRRGGIPNFLFFWV